MHMFCNSLFLYIFRYIQHNFKKDYVLSVKCYQAATGLELQTWSFGSPIQKLYGTAQTALRIYANHNPPALYMTFVSVSQFQFREGWFPAMYTRLVPYPVLLSKS